MEGPFLRSVVWCNAESVQACNRETHPQTRATPLPLTFSLRAHSRGLGAGGNLKRFNSVHITCAYRNSIYFRLIILFM